MNEKDLRILNVSFSYGKVHDFKLFCESNLHFSKDVLLIADKGYLGIKKIHSNSLILKKSTKEAQIDERGKEKQFNYFKAENLHRACEQMY